MVDEPKEQPKEEVKEVQEESKELDVDKLTDTIMEKMKGKLPAQESEDYEDLGVEADSEAFEPSAESEDIDYKKKYQELQHKTKAKSVGENALKEFPNANDRVVESLVEKGASEKAIRNAARISHNEFLRGQKETGITREQIKQEVEKELAGKWGHPDSGEVGGSDYILTDEKLAKMRPRERKEAVAKYPYKGSQVTEEIDWK